MVLNNSIHLGVQKFQHHLNSSGKFLGLAHCASPGWSWILYCTSCLPPHFTRLGWARCSSLKRRLQFHNRQVQLFANCISALRQGGLESVFFWVAYLPLALFFSPMLFYVHRQVNSVFQFFVHTQTIGKLPWIIEFIFNTPSHHRVHHGNSPDY